MEYREAGRIECVRHIIVRGAIDVLFQQSDRSTMTVTGGEAAHSVTASFIGDKMILTREETGCCNFGDTVATFGIGGIKTVVNGKLVSPSRHEKVTAKITLRDLREFTLQGAGDMVLSGLEQPDLKIELQGSGTVEGVGRVGNLEISVKGAGSVDASYLLAEHGVLRISGTGNISAAIQSDVCAEISGIGDIAVYGNPRGRRTQRLTGMGSIRYK